MSTRCTVHFRYHSSPEESKSIVYRHCDGYPEGAGRDLHRFLDECAKLEDTRFNDPCYLASKYVVWLASQFACKYGPGFTRIPVEAWSLDFISVGVCMADPSDIEYRYVVTCSGAERPKVECFLAPDGDLVEGWEVKNSGEENNDR